MARLLRLLPDPACAHEPGGVDPPKITLVSLAAVYRSSMQRSPPVPRPVSGACPDIRRSNRPCATTTSTHSVSPDSMSRFQLNPVEPPCYATRMPGGVGGWHREVSPYPDLPPITDPQRGYQASDFITSVGLE